jgi:hypothetical protein
LSGIISIFFLPGAFGFGLGLAVIFGFGIGAGLTPGRFGAGFLGAGFFIFGIT